MKNLNRSFVKIFLAISILFVFGSACNFNIDELTGKHPDRFANEWPEPVASWYPDPLLTGYPEPSASPSPSPSPCYSAHSMSPVDLSPGCHSPASLVASAEWNSTTPNTLNVRILKLQYGHSFELRNVDYRGDSESSSFFCDLRADAENEQIYSCEYRGYLQLAWSKAKPAFSEMTIVGMSFIDRDCGERVELQRRYCGVNDRYSMTVGGAYFPNIFAGY